MWVSVTIPALYAISLEIGDGFSHYEFAPNDLLANALRLGYGVLQRRYQYLDNFTFNVELYTNKSVSWTSQLPNHERLRWAHLLVKLQDV